MVLVLLMTRNLLDAGERPSEGQCVTMQPKMPNQAVLFGLIDPTAYSSTSVATFRCIREARTPSNLKAFRCYFRRARSRKLPVFVRSFPCCKYFDLRSIKSYIVLIFDVNIHQLVVNSSQDSLTRF